MKILVSLSGGKDSTACLLWALDTFNKNDIIPFYIDTKWEHDSVYTYLDYLAKKLDIKIKRIESEGMIELSKRKKMMPNRVMRFCTENLKVKPAKEFYNSMKEDFIVIIGVRRDESTTRSNEKTFKIVDGIKILQPLAYWDTQRVFDFHKEKGIDVNPLYKKGFKRVGCYPCIFARKHELMMMEDKYKKRLRNLENDVSLILGHSAKFFAKDVDKHLRPSLDLGMENYCVNQYGICG